MSSNADLQGLTDLAALDLRLAKHFAARAEAAEDDDVANALARTYQRMARSYRQSLAMQDRLVGSRARAEREDARLDRDDQQRRIQTRKAQVAACVTKLIWNEHEQDREKAEELEGTLDELLDEAAVFDAFMDGPFEAQVERLREELGLTEPDVSAEGRRSEPGKHEPAEGAPEPCADDDYWRSSA
ncbi:MAG: hypothetical protein JWQ29_1301 [Phenylobacterium sp.]|nr:hypothetical protein [Phenylobacterium sp.]